MRRKLIYLVSFVLVLGLVRTSTGQNVDLSLVGWWKFEEASGTLFDQSDNHNDGTSFNGVLYQQTGQVGYALGFDGIDDYVVVGTTGRPSDTFSFGGWFKTSVTHEIDAEATSGYGGVNNQKYAFDPQHGGDLNAGAGLSIGTNGIAVYEHGSDYMPATATYPTELGNDWNHIMIVYNNKQPTIYLNGHAVRTGFSSPRAIVYPPIQFGGMAYGYFEGLMDEVRIYNRALSAAEIRKLAARPKAWNPSPANGVMHEDTWVSLGWLPGGYAVSHDVYLGDNFDDVNDGTGDTFRGNQTDTFFVAGFPGFPYPDGLVPGTTYYWRIDEVNDPDPNSPWKGDVWSFMIPPRKAYGLYPPDGTYFIDPNVELSWTVGFGAKLHTVYFGDNFDDVNDAAGGAPQGAATYTPGPLELDKVYYWRVDEFDAITTHKGDVLSFRTTTPGLGKVIYETWQNIPGTDLDALKNSWKYPDSPDSSEELTSFGIDEDMDNYGGRIHGWLYVPATGDYTFWLASDDEGEVWLSTDDDPSNVVRIAHEPSWAAYNSFNQKSNPVFLVGGNKYYISALWKEGEGGDNCQVAWQGPGVPTRVVIPGSNLSPYDPVQAFGPNPKDGGTGVKQTAILSWKAGKYAASHQVYFGADEDVVKNATTSSPEYKGSKTLGSESYDPGKLPWLTTYYWRVDEVNNVHPDSPWIGKVWSFTTADFLVVDDFESYNDLDPGDPASNRIFNTWIDGYEQPTNGSTVGYFDPPFCEQTIVHSGRQSMPLFYDNSGPAYYSEATLPLIYPRDWTEEGVEILTLWFYGDPTNAAESMYVAVANATGPTAVVYHDNPDTLLIGAWTHWNINLEEISNAGVVLTNVDRLAIGFGNRNNPQAGGSGMVFIDDIRLYRPAIEP